MGQARSRGTFEERRHQAIKEGREKQSRRRPAAITRDWSDDEYFSALLPLVTVGMKMWRPGRDRST